MKNRQLTIACTCIQQINVVLAEHTGNKYKESSCTIQKTTLFWLYIVV